MSPVALEELLAIEPSSVRLSELSVHEPFQPRVTQLLPARHLIGVQTRSDEHVDSLLRKLQSAEEFQLDPILAVEISDNESLSPGLYVLDGHHRLASYSQAGRKIIPVRKCTLLYRDALLISKLANCSHRSMKMHREQRRDAAWQWLVISTEGGSKPYPKVASLRWMAAQFDISKNTADRMKKRLREIDPRSYGASTLAPETGWPRWKYTREPKDPWQKHLADLSPTARTEQEARLFLGRYVELLSNASAEVRAYAKVLLQADAFYEESLESADFDFLLSFYK